MHMNVMRSMHMILCPEFPTYGHESRGMHNAYEMIDRPIIVHL